MLQMKKPLFIFVYWRDTDRMLYLQDISESPQTILLQSIRQPPENYSYQLPTSPHPLLLPLMKVSKHHTEVLTRRILIQPSKF